MNWLMRPQMYEGFRARGLSRDRAFFSGLVAAYLFNEGGGTVLHDYSGNNHHGTITGASWSTGAGGIGLEFSGASDRVELPDAVGDAVADSGAVTVVWSNDDSTFRGYVFDTRLGIGDGWDFFIEDGLPAGEMGFIIDTGGSSSASSSISGINGPAVATATFDGTNLAMYVNGFLGGTAVRAGTATRSGVTTIGNRGDTLNRPFKAGRVMHAVYVHDYDPGVIGRIHADPFGPFRLTRPIPFSPPAIIEAALTVGIQAGLVSGAQASMSAALAQGVNAAVTAAKAAVIDVATSEGLTAAFTALGQRQAEAQFNAALTVALANVDQADFQVEIDASATLAFASVAQMDAQAQAAFSQNMAMALASTIVLPPPSFRTVTVPSDGRTLTVSSDGRTITVRGS